MSNQKTITDHVLRVLNEKKVSTTRLAEEIGVSRQALTKMLARPYLSTDHLDKMCTYLNYDFYQHLGQDRRQPPMVSITIPLTKENSAALLKLAGVQP